MRATPKKQITMATFVHVLIVSPIMIQAQSAAQNGTVKLIVY